MKVQIGTYNIQHGVDRLHYLKTKEWKVDLPAVVNAIRTMELDICGLQEVYDHDSLDGGKEQAKVIGEQLGYYYAFAKGSVYRWGECGNALVSKFPILSTRLIPMQVPMEKRIEGAYYDDRVMLVAELSINGRTVTVICTHFGLHADELNLAVDSVRAVVGEIKTPMIFMGDLNFGPSEHYYGRLCEVMTDTATLMKVSDNTFPSEAPNNRIDYIFVNDQVKVLDACVPELIVTDHRPYKIVVDI